MLGEMKMKLTDLSDLERFMERVRKVETKRGKKALKLFIVGTVDRSISRELRGRCEEKGIELIVGRGRSSLLALESEQE